MNVVLRFENDSQMKKKSLKNRIVKRIINEVFMYGVTNINEFKSEINK